VYIHAQSEPDRTHPLHLPTYEPRVTIDDAAQMLEWSHAQMKAAISGAIAGDEAV